MISVIVPVYKAEKNITRCIESIIIQDYQDWELILVDDGSPDRSGTICDEYAAKDNRILVVHQENAGASAARNHGIDEAKGEYICFIDADDYVTERYLSAFEVDDKHVDFAIQGMTLTFEDKTLNHDKLPSFSGFYELSELLSQNDSTLDLLNGPCCKLYRTRIIREHQIRFPDALSYGEDSIFVLAYLNQCEKMYVAALSNYCYTHENAQSLSSTRQDGLKMMAAVIQDFNWFISLNTRICNMPDSYIEYYRNYKALMFYNAVHNQLISTSSYRSRVSFMQSIPHEMCVFFQSAVNLPITYRMIQRLQRWFPMFLMVRLYPVIYRFASLLHK